MNEILRDRVLVHLVAQLDRVRGDFERGGFADADR
jgi:hypothetical protein